MKTLSKATPVRIPRELVKLAAVIATSVILYRWAHGYATALRGYEAIGGEIFLPLLLWLAYLRR